MESAGMMKMASGDGFPLRQGAGMGLDWLLVATEASSGETPDLGLFLGVSIFIGIFGVGNKSWGSTKRRQDRGRALHTCGGLVAPLTYFF